MIRRCYGKHRRCEESPSEPDPQLTPGEDSCKSVPQPRPAPGRSWHSRKRRARRGDQHPRQHRGAHPEHQYTLVRRQILRPPAQARHIDHRRYRGNAHGNASSYSSISSASRASNSSSQRSSSAGAPSRTRNSRRWSQNSRRAT